MTWALRRQLLYVLIIVMFFLGCAFLIIYPSVNKAPTCTDQKQNGNEMGIDCGGSCSLQCLSQVDPISILWARSFRVVAGRYNATAYLENNNRNNVVNKINYSFRFADANNVFIGKREGSTYIPPSGKFAVFESGIDVGNSVPVYTTFEFTQVPQWVTVSQDRVNQLKVSISNINLANEATSPTLSATVKNNSFLTIVDPNFIVILYDENHNAISASKTYLDKLSAEEVKDINFTWPEPMPAKVVTKEIIPLYNIFSVKLK